jgi:hypothetical protein
VIVSVPKLTELACSAVAEETENTVLKPDRHGGIFRNEIFAKPGTASVEVFMSKAIKGGRREIGIDNKEFGNSKSGFLNISVGCPTEV